MLEKLLKIHNSIIRVFVTLFKKKKEISTIIIKILKKRKKEKKRERRRAAGKREEKRKKGEEKNATKRVIVGVFSWRRRGREGPSERGVEKTRGEYSATTGNYSLLSPSFQHEERHRRVRTFIRKFTNTRPTCTLLISHRCSFVRSFVRSFVVNHHPAARRSPHHHRGRFARSHRPIPAAAQFHRFPSFLLPFPLVPLRLGSTSVHPPPHLSTYRTFYRVRPCLCLCTCIREHRVLRELPPIPCRIRTDSHTYVHAHEHVFKHILNYAPVHL